MTHAFTSRRRLLALCLTLGAATLPVQAQAPASPTTAEGEVRRIDLDTRKITLRHGEIKNLDMPPMTMVFQVTDAAMLQGLKVGDRVTFSAEKRANTYVVTGLEKAR